MTIPCIHVVPSMHQAPAKQIPRTYQASTKHLPSICQVIGNHLTCIHQASANQVTSTCQVSNTGDKQEPISWVSLFLSISILASNKSPIVRRILKLNYNLDEYHWFRGHPLLISSIFYHIWYDDTMRHLFSVILPEMVERGPNLFFKYFYFLFGPVLF